MKKIRLSVWLISLLLCAAAGARRTPSSDLLVPYFEVDLTGAGATTMFAVVNSSPEPVPVTMTVHTNWGIEILRTAAVLEGDQVTTVDLAQWLVRGKLLDRELDAGEIEHFQAAVSGRRSPRDDLYYATELDHGKAVGYVTIRAPKSSDVLFGDSFLVDPEQDLAQGDVLVDIDASHGFGDTCRRHGLRFLSGGGFDAGTQILIWTPKALEPSADPYFPSREKMAADVSAYEQSGRSLGRHELDLLPLEVITISELGLDARFGWLDFTTGGESFVAVRYAAQKRFSAGLQTFCMPDPPVEPFESPQPAIWITASANGDDTDLPPGPSVRAGDEILWEYAVHNRGNVPLDGISVVDDLGVSIACPERSLEPGASMVCSGRSSADEGQHRNLARAFGTSPQGQEVGDGDVSHYYGEPRWTGRQGCQAAYWSQHTDAWIPTGFWVGQAARIVFGEMHDYPALTPATLREALGFADGGGGTEGAARRLLRTGVAALLNSTHPDVSYPRATGEVIADVEAALASGHRGAMLGLAARLEADNDLGCPLD